MSPPNENAPAWDQRARQSISSQSKPQPGSAFKPNSREDDLEQRRNTAACFRNRRKREKWEPDFIGVLVPDDLPTGAKVWVSIRERVSTKGQRYLSVVLKRQTPRNGSARKECK
jgi:hypothetical protein